MIRSVYIALLVLLWAAAAFGQAASVAPADIAQLIGNWSGSLTYLDYQANKKTSIRSDLKVSSAGADPRAWMFDYLYPDEPKANGKSLVKLSADGRTFNGQTVAKTAKLPDGTLSIVTVTEGIDNDGPALFRYTYLLGKSKFSITKEVRAAGSETFFERNTYSWTR